MAPQTEVGHFAFYCLPGALRRALKNGADPNVADPDTGTTPLMWLCEMHSRHHRERRRMFRILLRFGASLEATDFDGSNIWHYAKLGSAKTFRRFIRSEYRRILGYNPKMTITRESLNRTRQHSTNNA